MTQAVYWIEINCDPKKTDISSWINPDGSLNVEKMREEIKKDLIEAVEETERWQKWAIESSLPVR